MARHKGELSPFGIDLGWPHQVALSSEVTRARYKEIREFGARLSLAPRGHSVFHEGEWYNVYCFADAADAKLFLDRFSGEPFDPRERGRGAHWMQWRKGTANKGN